MEPISSNCQYEFCSLYNTGYIYVAGDYYEVLLVERIEVPKEGKKQKQICPPAMSCQALLCQIRTFECLKY